jgi:purine-binding chemotaxis protein CheW
MEEINIDQVNEEIVEDAQEGRHLTFIIGKEEYGIEIKHVTEIIGIQKITDLPNLPSFIKGVINLRGKVIPVLDVRLRFNFEEREYDDRTCIIVVNINDTSVGLIVDQVSEVMDIPAENVELPPKISIATSNRYIQAFGKIGEEVKILLDTQKLLFDEELEQLVNSVAEDE